MPVLLCLKRMIQVTIKRRGTGFESRITSFEVPVLIEDRLGSSRVYVMLRCSTPKEVFAMTSSPVIQRDA